MCPRFLCGSHFCVDSIAFTDFYSTLYRRLPYATVLECYHHRIGAFMILTLTPNTGEGAVRHIENVFGIIYGARGNFTSKDND